MAKVYGERWEIVESLDEGGQAHTFIVKDTSKEKEEKYVLKRLKNVSRLDRFKDEVRAVDELNHPNIIELVDYNLDVEKPYLVTEYYKNGNLTNLNSNLTDVELLEIFAQIVNGVSAVHELGFVHRDLKPENILIGNNNSVYIADFGLVYIEDNQRKTLVDEAVGPMYFMAPELEDGRAESISPASDVYSLGKLLYWLLSNKNIFSREKYRQDTYNLVKVHNNPKYEHINKVLDNMITDELSERRKNATALKDDITQLIKLIEGNYNVVSNDLQQPCMYCGLGDYKLIIRGNDMELRNFGFRNVSGNEWRILACDKCGHIQLFRVDYAENKEWWD